MTGMSRDEVLALPVVVDLVTAGRAWGWTRSRVYEHHAAGQLPFEVVTVGGRYKVTREALLRSLGISDMDVAGSDNPASATTATELEPPHESRYIRAAG